MAFVLKSMRIQREYERFIQDIVDARRQAGQKSSFGHVISEAVHAMAKGSLPPPRHRDKGESVEEVKELENDGKSDAGMVGRKAEDWTQNSGRDAGQTQAWPIPASR
jgi:hypothetical protein